MGAGGSDSIGVSLACFADTPLRPRLRSKLSRRSSEAPKPTSQRQTECSAQTGPQRHAGTGTTIALESSCDSCRSVEYSRRHADLRAYRTAGHSGVRHRRKPLRQGARSGADPAGRPGPGCDTDRQDQHRRPPAAIRFRDLDQWRHSHRRSLQPTGPSARAQKACFCWDATCSISRSSTSSGGKSSGSTISIFFRNPSPTAWF